MSRTDAEFIVPPFTVVIDTREQAPWSFLNIRADAKDDAKPLLVKTVQKTLTTGDYSIEGLESRVCVERKSKEDAFGSLGQGRRRFQAEFERMAKMRYSALVVECSVSEVLHQPPRFSKMSPKAIMRTWCSWSIRYPRTHWFFMPSRAEAETMAYRLLARFWELQTGGEI